MNRICTSFLLISFLSISNYSVSKQAEHLHMPLFKYNVTCCLFNTRTHLSRLLSSNHKHDLICTFSVYVSQSNSIHINTDLNKPRRIVGLHCWNVLCNNLITTVGYSAILIDYNKTISGRGQRRVRKRRVYAFQKFNATVLNTVILSN